jgi:hypothetical protein
MDDAEQAREFGELLQRLARLHQTAGGPEVPGKTPNE